MATKATQGLTIFKKKGVQLKNASFLIAIKKTGYANVTVNGKKIYYDERIETNKISNEVIAIAFAGGKNQSQKKKKGTIVVRKK